MFAHLVSGRYGAPTEAAHPAPHATHPGWIRRLLNALFGKKS